MSSSDQKMITWNKQLLDVAQSLNWKVPMVEIYETIEGEGNKAGYPTIFVRVFHCNLRCTWCDTPYSYAPAVPEYTASVREIMNKVADYKSRYICLTGGEPLIHREKSAALIYHLFNLPQVEDIHIETNGAIDLAPFHEFRQQLPQGIQKIRFIMDYKLPSSGEQEKMIESNFSAMTHFDEIKFVIGSDEDFEAALQVIKRHAIKGTILMSPLWETMQPHQLADKIINHQLYHVKLNIQMHKLIWDPQQRGV